MDPIDELPEISDDDHTDDTLPFDGDEEDLQERFSSSVVVLPNIDEYTHLPADRRENVWETDVAVRYRNAANTVRAINAVEQWPLIGPVNASGEAAQLTKSRLKQLILLMQVPADQLANEITRI